MILLLAFIGGLCFWIFIFGLVVGEGWLRVPGLAGFVLSLAGIWAVDRLRERARVRRLERLPRQYAEGEHFDEIEIRWPRKAA